MPNGQVFKFDTEILDELDVKYTAYATNVNEYVARLTSALEEGMDWVSAASEETGEALRQQGDFSRKLNEYITGLAKSLKTVSEKINQDDSSYGEGSLKSSLEACIRSMEAAISEYEAQVGSKK